MENLFGWSWALPLVIAIFLFFSLSLFFFTLLLSLPSIASLCSPKHDPREWACLRPKKWWTPNGRRLWMRLPWARWACSHLCILLSLSLSLFLWPYFSYFTPKLLHGKKKKGRERKESKVQFPCFQREERREKKKTPAYGSSRARRRMEKIDKIQKKQNKQRRDRKGQKQREESRWRQLRVKNRIMGAKKRGRGI